MEGGVSGVRTPQNRTEIRINTAQNNIRKPQTALKLPENFKILQTAWFCKTTIPQLEKKNFRKTASMQTLTLRHNCKIDFISFTDLFYA